MPADALDDDYDRQPKYYGPGRRQPARGPVIEAYADGSIEQPCPDCAADAYSFCQHPNGTFRMTPCRGRQAATCIQKPLAANNTRENRTDA